MSIVTPDSTAELTAGWFSEVFEGDVAEANVVDAHSGTTGRARVQLTSSDERIPNSVFVKLQPFDADQRAILQMIKMGVSEAQFYRAVGDTLPVVAPRSWFAQCDPADGSFVIVLDDLAARGCRFCDAEDDDIADVAVSLMDEFALLHGTYWGDDLDWLATHAMTPGDDTEHAETRAMGALLVQSAVEQFAADLPAEFAEMGDLYATHHADIEELSSEGERTLVHGDAHIGNFFVDDGRVGFYDWAGAMRLPGMRDVAYFLCTSVPTDVRRSEENNLLERYRLGLAQHGVDIPRETIDAQYRINAIASWVAAAATAAMGSGWQPIDVAMRATERSTQAIIDLDVLGHVKDRLA